MVVGKFREFYTVPEDGKIIGSVYIARGDHRGKPVLHIDAFQPHKSEAVPAKFVENFLKELKKQKDPQFRTISMNSGAQFSNHEPYQAAIKKVLGSLQHSNSKVTGLPESSQSSSRSGHIVLGSKNE